MHPFVWPKEQNISMLVWVAFVLSYTQLLLICIIRALESIIGEKPKVGKLVLAKIEKSKFWKICQVTKENQAFRLVLTDFQSFANMKTHWKVSQYLFS